jgi:alpha-2-macroglobulin
VEVAMDGKSLRKVTINRENLFTFDGSLVLTGDALATGKHEIELKKTGKGTLYANAYLEVFTLEDKLRAAGLEVKVTRHLSKLIALEKENEVPDASGVVVKQQVERFRREPLVDGAKVASGDRIEVELVLESKNDYEYLLFSDAKAAGFEALDALSGYVGGGAGFSAYMEPRDQTVDFFIRALPRGTNTLRYQLRAEAPGIYKALPATAEAMYAPELRANSEDLKLEITE